MDSVTTAPPILTMLVPCPNPNPFPLIETTSPLETESGETDEIEGFGLEGFSVGSVPLSLHPTKIMMKKRTKTPDHIIFFITTPLVESYLINLCMGK